MLFIIKKSSVEFLFIFFFILFFQSCAQEDTLRKPPAQEDTLIALDSSRSSVQGNIVNPDGRTIESRFTPPIGFERKSLEENSFAAWLRCLPLKPHGTPVILYNGEKKSNLDAYDAVVELRIGNKNLHQCADAVIRLRADYLWQQNRYDEIHFNFTNGFRVDYSQWMQGKRIIVNGNKTQWALQRAPSNTYHDYWGYLETIFSYAGTLSLSRELIPMDIEELQIGDVFIQGGSPGHAIIVVDLAYNPSSRKIVFLLAQSYMPAQEIQILKNLQDEQSSPWYSLEFGDFLVTPEWTFKKTDLKRFDARLTE